MYVGLFLLASQEMVQCLKMAKRKELKASITDMSLKIMGLYTIIWNWKCKVCF